MRVLGKALTLLLIIGVLLGAWRYIGGGIGIGQPGWLAAAFDNVEGWFADLATWLREKIENIQSIA